MAPAKDPLKTPRGRASVGGAKATPTSQGAKNQRSILGFFQKSSPITPVATGSQAVLAPTPTPTATATSTTRSSQNIPSSSPSKKVSAQRLTKKAARLSLGNVTPVPSSDPVGPEEDEVDSHVNEFTLENDNIDTGSPNRRARKNVNYAESDDDEDDIVSTNSRAGKRRKTLAVPEDEDDAFEEEDMVDFSDLGNDVGRNETSRIGIDSLPDVDDFIAPDDSEEEALRTSTKRKRTASRQLKSKRSQTDLSRPSATDRLKEIQDMDMDEKAATSTAMKWIYDPSDTTPYTRSTIRPQLRTSTTQKLKAHMTEPEQRYPWLANIMDMDKHPPDHPDYDPRTIYIPPMAWAKFSPFEKQYWEIKQKFWDTVVFFKKGKFYELYENDATIGHQLFDLKLTDRVNMRMVGVPEMSLEYWASQFVAKGFKVARVDQKETALGKEMREKDVKGPTKAEKVIRRELESVLTGGTLVDGAMLQNDMATYCVAIKEAIVDQRPSFGIAFVDTATGQFFLSEFTDDVDLTRFETFVAQTRPQELLLEKGNTSTRATRILKQNTSVTTIWNSLKPVKEFWEAETTRFELDTNNYFEENQWPDVLVEAKKKDLVMSAFGALIQYLRMLKIERDIVTIGNFAWYDPIHASSTLVLDGKTLINLEVFANSHDGSATGTLFRLLNNCITPFGKREFMQWVCHPLMDSVKINERLDAVETLNADNMFRDQFSSELSKLPDLERLISRIHAGTCKPQDFVRVFEGFEQIEYTINLLKGSGGKTGEGIIGQLLQSMPNLSEILESWQTKFDRKEARENGFIIPCGPGEFEDYDESQGRIDHIETELEEYLKAARKRFKSSAICYRDNGKEIYQLELPTKIKDVPKNWSQMSATKQVKRYYSPELRAMIRELQEAQEIHSQIVRDLRRRIYERFDKDYAQWLAAIKVVAQLDCLVGLAKASLLLGYPSCRPEFVESERGVLEFKELRHPCMLPNAGDFIPNDISLGGENPNINLLTGANAAGKSTVLRMTCTAVIMAQIGCYVPCRSARLTTCDRIMSRLGANDNIFAAQSTFFVELSETKKILSEATPRSLVILDELGRGTSSYDGVAVAQAVLHHVATHLGCIGFFATHYHSLAAEFEAHPEIAARRMRIHVDEEEKHVTFLYKLEPGVAEGSFGMHCASMCGIPDKVVEEAEVAAKQWEHTSRLKDTLERKKGGGLLSLGWWSDVAWAIKEEDSADQNDKPAVTERGINALLKAVESM
ncbi:DNA mismatch repair protein msh6 [Ascosphaera aggregata]|nr:DNA mismatch repair protein msh6 [Ascosphaera aggregata]